MSEMDDIQDAKNRLAIIRTLIMQAAENGGQFKLSDQQVSVEGNPTSMGDLLALERRLVQEINGLINNLYPVTISRPYRHK
jgi:hypothetical protein